jgi:DNA mismatch repair protein MutL
MGIIKLLPDHTANQIAAGEVVQRPASVVKELLENSVDAGASKITLHIKDGGKALIQVSDNGSGMNELDARLCWERHATSKLNAIEDLFSLHTFGFRGEALASIAAVAQVDMKTRRAEEEVGTHILIEGSEVKKQEAIAIPHGTTISVRNLFFNVPARRSFLKSDAVETNHIIEEFVRVALANPDTGFVMTNNDTEVYHVLPGSLKQRILSIFGHKYTENILQVNESTGIANIYGFAGKPDFAKKTRGEQYFFVNHRFIRNNYLNHAVVGAYQDLMPTDNFPFYVLFIDLDPSTIDINVHPTKTEIKFREEKNLYTILKAVVKRSLGQHTLTPQLDFDTPAAIQNFNPSFYNRDEIPSPPQIKTDPGYNPFKTDTYRPAQPTYRVQSNQRNWQQIYENASSPIVTESQISAHDHFEESAKAELQPKQLMQLNQQYILSPLKSGLMIIDQRAAHERILYERYLGQLEKHDGSSQRLLFPSIVQFSASDMALIQDLAPEFTALGFVIDDFGNNQVVINGVPTEASDANPQQLFEGMLENYKQSKTDVKLTRREGIAQSIAKRLSINYGKRLNDAEMRNLVDELFACTMPFATPDGRATLKTLTLEDIGKMMG